VSNAGLGYYFVILYNKGEEWILETGFPSLICSIYVCMMGINLCLNVSGYLHQSIKNMITELYLCRYVKTYVKYGHYQWCLMNLSYNVICADTVYVYASSIWWIALTNLLQVFWGIQFYLNVTNELICICQLCDQVSVDVLQGLCWDWCWQISIVLYLIYPFIELHLIYIVYHKIHLFAIVLNTSHM
jgi:hypothetical protein